MRRFVTFRPREQVILPELNVGPDWPIYNAARPIPGTVTWQRKGIGVGWFYAAVDPADRYAAQFRRRCAELDACVLVFAAPAEAWGRAYCQAKGYDPAAVDLTEFSRWAQRRYRELLGHLEEDE